MSYKEEEREFYRLFNSIEVVPAFYESNLQQYLQENKTFLIPELTISLSFSHFQRLEDEGRIRRYKNYFITTANYDPKIGLQL